MKIVGQMAISDFPLWEQSLQNLCKYSQEIYIRFDGIKGNRSFLPKIVEICGEKLKNLLISNTPWDKWMWREEMLRMLDNIPQKPDIVLQLDQDEMFDDFLQSDIEVFKHIPQEFAMFIYHSLPTEDNITLFEGNPYPLLPHCKMYKWKKGLTFKNYKGFCLPSIFYKQPYYIPKAHLYHYCFYKKEDRFKKINVINSYYPDIFNKIYEIKDIYNEFFNWHNIPEKYKNKKIAIYTTNFGHYDNIYPTLEFNELNIDWFYFTDNKNINNNVNGWNIKHFEVLDKNPRLTSRYYKINSHEILPEYDIIIYIDSNMQILNKNFINFCLYHYNEELGFTIQKHNKRTNIFQEYDVLFNRYYNKKYNEKLLVQIEDYKKNNFIAETPLYLGGLLIRNNNENTKKINETWYNEFKKYPFRDQLSLPYILWKNNYKVNSIDFCAFNNFFIKINKHTKPF